MIFQQINAHIQQFRLTLKSQSLSSQRFNTRIYMIEYFNESAMIFFISKTDINPFKNESYLSNGLKSPKPVCVSSIFGSSKARRLGPAWNPSSTSICCSSIIILRLVTLNEKPYYSSTHTKKNPSRTTLYLVRTIFVVV